MPNQCRICAGTDCCFCFILDGYTLERCARCDFVQVTEEPSAAILETIYSDLHFKHLKFRDANAVTWENSRRLSLLRRFLPDGSHVLDAGCAIGDFLKLAKINFTVSGVDISQGAIEVAKENNPDLAGRLWAAPLENLGPAAGQYDAISLWDVIEHVWDPVAVCRTLMRHVRPGGLLFISTPDAGALMARISGRKWAFMMPPEHLSLFSKRTFRLMWNEILPASIIYHRSHGKWTNLAFILYKLRRIDRRLVPMWLLTFMARSFLGRCMIYVPTGDIQYLVVQKPSGPRSI
jgi:2-polyprenyl-3-methyl-5-hydroxy-6-metoxy-1,4-benzoquinol methylase